MGAGSCGIEEAAADRAALEARPPPPRRPARGAPSTALDGRDENPGVAGEEGTSPPRLEAQRAEDWDISLGVLKEARGGRVDDASSRRADRRLELGDRSQGAFELVLQMANSQQAADPAEQLDLVHRLGQEVVRPGLELTLEIRRFVECGDHEDEQVPGRRPGERPRSALSDH